MADAEADGRNSHRQGDVAVRGGRISDGFHVKHCLYGCGIDLSGSRSIANLLDYDIQGRNTADAAAASRAGGFKVVFRRHIMPTNSTSGSDSL